ncbi:MAG: hypothetical protein JKY83_07510, partial [Rhizobiaceae bacterium]|nr:hypothetical protein [Rhizobiaceae bacterium]
KLPKGSELVHPVHQQAYLLVSEGELELDGKLMRKGDGAEIIGEQSFSLKVLSDADVLVIDVPK